MLLYILYIRIIYMIILVLKWEAYTGEIRFDILLEKKLKKDKRDTLKGEASSVYVFSHTALIFEETYHPWIGFFRTSIMIFNYLWRHFRVAGTPSHHPATTAPLRNAERIFDFQIPNAILVKLQMRAVECEIHINSFIKKDHMRSTTVQGVFSYIEIIWQIRSVKSENILPPPRSKIISPI